VNRRQLVRSAARGCLPSEEPPSDVRTRAETGETGRRIAITLALPNRLAGSVPIQRRFRHLGDLIPFSGVEDPVVSIGVVKVVGRTESGALATVSHTRLLAGPVVNFTFLTRGRESTELRRVPRAAHAGPGTS
jgi:hypothetical protein